MQYSFSPLDYQRALADSQWLPAEEIRRHQWQALEALVRHAWKTIPGQRDRLKAAGYRVGEPLSEEVFQAIQPQTRQEIQSGGAAWHSTAVPPEHGSIVSVTSSGSTGRPITVQGTVHDVAMGKAFNLRLALWHDLDFAKTLAVVRRHTHVEATYPRGAGQERWGDSATFPFPTGRAELLSVHESVADQAKWLVRLSPDYLATYPSNLRFLARHCQRQDIRLPRLQKVLTASEMISQEDRDACWQAFGVPVVDVYSAKEISAAATQCPEHEHYHEQSERILVEVLDDENRPVAPGKIGQVVVSVLHNYAQPLIRYAIGDLAERGVECPCGRGLPVLNRIMGRVRNMLTTPDGNQYWPSLASSSLRNVAPVRQLQIVQTSLEALQLNLVVERVLSPDEEVALLALVQSRMPAPFVMTFNYVPDIPRSDSGKYEDFYSLVSA